MKRKTVLFSTIIFYVIMNFTLYQACGRSGKQEVNKSLQKVTIALPKSSSLGYTIYVGQEKGYFKDEGIDLVIMDSYPHGLATIQALVSGETDLAVSSETPFLHEVMNGAKISAFAQTLYPLKHLAIVARKDKGIASPMDLAGKRIGVSLGTNAEYFLDEFRETKQIPKPDFIKIDLEPQELMRAIKGGSIDALVSWNPYYNQAQEALVDTGITFYSDIHAIMFLISARQSFIDNQKSTIEHILRAMLKSSEFINENKEEADGIAARGMGIDEKIMRHSSAEYRFDVRLDQSLISLLENEARWEIKKKLTTATEVPNFLEHVYTGGLQKVQPDANTMYTAAPEKIRIAVGKHPLSGLMFIARSNGYFKKQGLDVEYQIYGSGKTCLEMVNEGKCDLAVAGDIPIMYGIMEDQAISIIASIEHTKENNVIIARKDLGISVPTDLVGKKIGVTLRTGSEFFLDSFMLFYGMTGDSATIINISPANIVNALLSGEVDAVSTWYPQAGVLLDRLQDNGLLFVEKFIYTGSQNIVGKREYTRKSPQTIRNILTALNEASGFIEEQPAEARKIIAKEVGMDVKELADIWHIYDYHLGLDQTLPLTLRDEARWAMRNKLVTKTKIPDFISYIYLEPLKEIAPTTVTISR